MIHLRLTRSLERTPLSHVSFPEPPGRISPGRAPLSFYVRHIMLADIRTLFCKWTPWESQVLAGLSGSLAAQHRAVLQAQIDAITKVQRIVGWTEIDFYVMRRGRVCLIGVPTFSDQCEFRLAKATTVVDGVIIQSELFCVA